MVRVRGVTTWILAITIAIYAAQLLAGAWVTNALALVQELVITEPWRLFTSMFVHSPSNPFHLVFNMLVLFFFGPLVEQKIGSNRFLALYIGAGLVAAVAAALFYPVAVGASGAIMGVLGLAVILAPNLKVLLWGVVPMTLKTLIILFIIIDIFNTISASNIATMAHFAGLATGMLYGLSLKKRRPKKGVRRTPKTQLDANDIEEYFRSGRI